MSKPRTIKEALARADELRGQADQLRAEADVLETKWTGVRNGQVLSVRTLIETIERIAGEK